MTRPPCKGCEFRRVGCHDPAACSRWEKFLTSREQFLAAQPSRQEVELMSEYLSDQRRRYLRQEGRKNRRKA